MSDFEKFDRVYCMARRRRAAAKRVSATKAQRSLAELLSRVSYGGEEFIIERAGRPVAKLTTAGVRDQSKRKVLTWGEYVERRKKHPWPDEFVKIVNKLVRRRPPAPPPLSFE